MSARKSPSPRKTPNETSSEEHPTLSSPRPIATEHVLIRTVLYLHHQLARTSARTELSPSQYMLMHFLYEQPRLASDFAAVNKLQQPSVTGLVQRLEERGLIERTVDESDRRARIVRLTAAGRQSFHEYEAILEKELATYLGLEAVDAAGEDLLGLYQLWNDKRVERYENWRRRRTERHETQEPG